VKHRS